MKRLAFLLIPLVALCLVHGEGSLAKSNVDAEACHHNLDRDRGTAATIADPAKRGEAESHLKAAYADELASKFTDCLSELKAAEALMQ